MTKVIFCRMIYVMDISILAMFCVEFQLSSEKASTIRAIADLAWTLF